MALVMSPAIGSADGMTPTDNRPASDPEVLRSVSISCWSDVQLSRIACPFQHALAIGGEPVESLPALDNRHAELLLELPDHAQTQARPADI
jgi:hypothetical protein